MRPARYKRGYSIPRLRHAASASQSKGKRMADVADGDLVPLAPAAFAAPLGPTPET